MSERKPTLRNHSATYQGYGVLGRTYRIVVTCECGWTATEPSRADARKTHKKHATPCPSCGDTREVFVDSGWGTCRDCIR
jgi:ribosomal protein S14